MKRHAGGDEGNDRLFRHNAPPWLE